MLATYNPERLLELETNISDYAIGAQIGQKDNNGNIRPIAFFSKKFHSVELNYPIYNKEFLAIITVIKEFKHYILGTKFKTKVYTNYKNIAYFAIIYKLSAR
jgi:RNase H-like domain found in reverse transcriptase